MPGPRHAERGSALRAKAPSLIWRVGTPTPVISPNSPQRVPIVILRVDDGAYLRCIGRLQVLGVPLDLLAVRPHGQVAQQNRLRERAGVAREVGHGWLAAPDGADPFLE